MKNILFKKRLLSIAGPTVALMIAGSAAQTMAAAFDSPVGDWDFYFTGKQKGVAQITFENDFSLSGLVINTPGKKPKVTQSDSRGIVLDPDNPRGGSASPNSYDLHYGASDIVGTWGFNLKGKIVGSATLISTNATNGFTFTGSVTEGRRITFNSTRFDSGARSVYQGVPRAVQPNLAGRYFVSGKTTPMFETGGQSHNEILDFTSTGYPNYYTVVQYGPGYVGGGFAVISSNKRMGIFTGHYTPGTTNLDIVSVSGMFNPAKLRGSVSGYDGTNWLSLKIGQIPSD